MVSPSTATASAHENTSAGPSTPTSHDPVRSRNPDRRAGESRSSISPVVGDDAAHGDGLGLGSLNLDISASASNLNGQLLLIAGAAIVVGATVVAFVPQFRDPVVVVTKTTWTRIGPLLSSPGRLISVVLANVLVHMGLSLAMSTVPRAFGQDVGFADVILVNVAIVDSATATAEALTYRLLCARLPERNAFSVWCCGDDVCGVRVRGRRGGRSDRCRSGPSGSRASDTSRSA